MFLFYQYFFLFYTVIQKETVWMPVQFLTVFCNVLKNMKRSVQDDTEIYKMAGSSTDFLSGKGLEAISFKYNQIIVATEYGLMIGLKIRSEYEVDGF